jgi:polyisoprenoid-binding protein YceI
MTKQIFITAFLALTGLTYSFTSERTDTYKVDTQKSTVEWLGEKKTGKHNGTLTVTGGEIKNKKGVITGSVEIDMNSIHVSDLADTASEHKLEKHLKGPDFFDVQKFPKASFVITSAVPREKGSTDFTHTVKGNLTIRDKTNEVSFDAIIKMEGRQFTCTGTCIVNREKFGISPGNKSAKDDFSVTFSIVANK